MSAKKKNEIKVKRKIIDDRNYVFVMNDVDAMSVYVCDEILIEVCVRFSMFVCLCPREFYFLYFSRDIQICAIGSYSKAHSYTRILNEFQCYHVVN